MGMRAVQAIAAVWLLSLGENFDHATAFLRAKDKAPLQTVERSFPDHIITGLTENFNSMKLPQLPSDTDRKLVLNGRMSDANRHGYVAHLSFPIIGLNWAGALISENLVLSTGAMLCSEEVGIGIQNYNMTATFGQGEDSESGKIINCVAHPRFNETGVMENDLALFLLDDELSDNLRQNPVKLGCNSEHKKIGNIQSLSWEYSSNRNPNDESFLRLSKGLYKLMNKKKCMEMLNDGEIFDELDNVDEYESDYLDEYEDGYDESSGNSNPQDESEFLRRRLDNIPDIMFDSHPATVARSSINLTDEDPGFDFDTIMCGRSQRYSMCSVPREVEPDLILIRGQKPAMIFGDYGAPVIVEGKSKKEDILVGIGSFLSSTCDVEKPSLFTDLSTYVDEIVEGSNYLKSKVTRESICMDVKCTDDESFRFKGGLNCLWLSAQNEKKRELNCKLTTGVGTTIAHYCVKTCSDSCA